MLKSAIVSVVLVAGVCSSAQAQTTTPNHVYQIVDETIQDLEVLVGAPIATTSQHDVATLPRHVYFAMLGQWGPIQTLRFKNGLRTSPVPSGQVDPIIPADVYQIANQNLDNIRELFSVVEAEPDAADAPLPADKTPTDVYGHVMTMAAALRDLDVPETTPDDVFQIASTLATAINNLAWMKGLPADFSAPPVFTDKTPTDVYAALSDLSADLSRYEQSDPKRNIDGGVTLPRLVEGEKRPADVIVLILWVLADVQALMVAGEVETKLDFSGIEFGRTPSDVYGMVTQAHNTVNALIDCESCIK